MPMVQRFCGNGASEIVTDQILPFNIPKVFRRPACQRDKAGHGLASLGYDDLFAGHHFLKGWRGGLGSMDVDGLRN
jgi:hypothetical protein